MKENSGLNNILVISLQGIGDLLLATPMLKGIKLNYPGSRLTVLTLSANKDILSNNPDVDDVITFDAGAGKNPAAIAALIMKLRNIRPGLSICAYPSGLRSAFLGYLSGAKERLGQDISLFEGYRWLFTKQVHIKEIKHAVLMDLDLLSPLGIDTSGIETNPVLNIGAAEEKGASKFLEDNRISDRDNLVAIHAGGGRHTAAYRSWPLDNFAKLAGMAIEKFGVKVLFIGGPSDEPAVKEISGKMGHPSITSAGKVSLMQTAALIRKSRALICNNSAPMHIAAALGVPTVSIFGSADPRIHRPYGQGHIVLRKELECGPCYYPFFRETLPETKARNRWRGKKFECASGDYRCLSSITPDDAMEALGKVLGGRTDK
ncbi:MAG: glycosyltransferase family 9 protein [Candidatus Omnitrophota bacterium]